MAAQRWALFAKIGESCCSAVLMRPTQDASSTPSQQPLSAPERVLAAELQSRGDSTGALSMMVTSMVHMVQAGKTPQSRWKAS
jgi:hypothetical protein